MLRVIVLLEGEPQSQSQISGRLKQVSLKNVFSSIHHSFNSYQFPSPCRWKTSPQHDVATTMLHGGDDVLGVMKDVGFAPDIAFSLMAKKLHFCLIWPDCLLPYVRGVSHMPFGLFSYLIVTRGQYFHFWKNNVPVVNRVFCQDKMLECAYNWQLRIENTLKFPKL